jgi:hypothetical protein
MPVDKPEKLDTLEIYSNFRWPDDIPKKPFNELTQEQQERLLMLYRFSGFKPGTYQGITGKGLAGS